MAQLGCISYYSKSIVFILWHNHIKVHKGWFKNLLKQGLGKKSRITVATSVLFCVVVVSGLSLLFVDGGNSTLGLAHYKIGLVAIVLFLFHVISRMKVLRKSLKM